MPTYPPVESVTRALRLLSRLNQREVSCLGDLHQAMRIPKPSLVRLLDTLIAMGYVHHDLARKGYRLEPAIRELSEGFHGGPLLVEAGRACCTDLTRRLKWTVSMAVLDGSEMAIVFTTLHDSPVSPFGRGLDKRRSLLTTGLGQAYLAFCSEAERKIITTMLKNGKDRAERKAIDEAVAKLVCRGARHGYTEREPGSVSAVTSTIGMPICGDGRLLGTVAMTFFTSALRRDGMQQTVVAPLRAAALTIGKNAERLIAQRRVREAQSFAEPPALQPADAFPALMESKPDPSLLL